MLRERLTSGEPFAVLSDLHANIDALDAALRRCGELGVRSIVILGDLLTYGCAPHEVLDRLEEIDCHLVRGNHDDFYDDPAPAFDRMPEWVCESIGWTRRTLGARTLPPAAEEIASAPLLLAHANPFGFGDWSYLDAPAAISRAGDQLRARGFRAGIFGHSHRPRITLFGSDGAIAEAPVAAGETTIDLATEVAVINAGSIGQPRGAGATLLLAGTDGRRMTLSHEPVAYDPREHCRRIAESGMTEATCRRLIEFFAA